MAIASVPTFAPSVALTVSFWKSKPSESCSLTHGKTQKLCEIDFFHV
jgi:hypothetical protein